MNILLLNGSPHKEGATYTALREVQQQLETHGLTTTLFHMGVKPVMGCIDCRKCEKTGYCIYKEDNVNECVDLLKQADGFVVGAPVYYAGPSGALCAFLDRLFYRKERFYAFKPAAAVVNCRRGGASAAFDRLNKYFTICRMPVVSSQYWNATHGRTPADVKQDREGLQTMRTLADNMAWLVKCIHHARETIPYPQVLPAERTDFIR